LLLKQEGVLMLSTDLSTRDCDGYVVVALRGELDLADAAEVGAVLGAVAARGPQIIVDLAGLEFIDSSGVAALARGRKHARQAGGDLLLAAPQQRVMRILVITCLAGGFPVYDSVEEAAVNPRHRMPAAAPAPGTAVWLSAHPPSAAVAALSTSVLSHRVGVAGKCSDTSDDRCYPALSEDPRSLEWVRYARAQCLGCTVRDECLELALRYEALTGASHGVWGGTAPNERKEMLARRRRIGPARRSRAQTLAAHRNLEQQTGSIAHVPGAQGDRGAFPQPEAAGYGGFLAGGNEPSSAMTNPFCSAQEQAAGHQA
jgi:anti-sigma B factor antagonist